MEIVASWSVGQYILKQADKCLWIIEKAAEWSVPVQPAPANKREYLFYFRLSSHFSQKLFKYLSPIIHRSHLDRPHLTASTVHRGHNTPRPLIYQIISI